MKRRIDGRYIVPKSAEVFVDRICFGLLVSAFVLALMWIR